MSFDNAPFVPRFVVGVAVAVGFLIMAATVTALQSCAAPEPLELEILEPSRGPVSSTLYRDRTAS